MRYARIVIGYHGCDVEVARRLVRGEAFRSSDNDYDWLGRGIYFWEYGADRAYRFAQEQKRRGKVKTPAVVGAMLQLGKCFDLMDTRFTQELREFFPIWRRALEAKGGEIPRNIGGEDRKLRRLDCAVMNGYLRRLEKVGQRYDTVRGCFEEGGPVFEGARIQFESHIQVAVRNQENILGVFQPLNEKETSWQES